jgi:hypothetical protein
MILISHRGNIYGKNKDLENSPEYIDYAMDLGYDVEIDLWLNSGMVSLGHDQAEYEIQLDWLATRIHKLWIHCKNIEAIEFMNDKPQFNYFWHQNDTVTLTSKNYIWAYPGTQPILNSIAVLPEIYNDSVENCVGVCSDEIVKYLFKKV